jgi:gliding motility-associated-like protein
MTRSLFIAFCLTAILVSPAQSQLYIMNGTPIQGCTGTFYDSGGSAGKYGNNEHYVTKICSDGSAGTHIQLVFSGIEIGPGDALCFHDGPTVAAPQLSCSSDYAPGAPFIVQATAENPSGCLTVEFTSDASGTANGWAAVIKCVASCQPVLAKLISTTPASVPVDTGWIDVCPGKRIFFNGQGNYPQNGYAYNQSDLTTTFEWNFGDGGIAYGPATSHKFDKAGGYYVQLILTDAQGCKSTNLINQRIRIAPRPDFNITGGLDHSICAGDTVHLEAALQAAAGKTLVVTPHTSAFAVAGSRSDSLALPDGTGIPYKTSIYFTEFSPGQVLTNVADLQNVHVNMEHSWLRDLEIKLTCPSGQKVVMHNFAGQTGTRVYLGIPNIGDGFSPIPGTGWDYYWVPNTPALTWIQYANTIFGASGGTLPSGNYSTYDPMSNLIGCPLNGEWTITATDLWPIDNGFIFSWGIKFADVLYPKIESFTPAFTNWSWNNHPSIFFSTADSIAAAPQNAGTAGYQFSVTDAFHCTWDTLVSVSVLPFTNPTCYKCNNLHFNTLRDTTVSSGSPVALNASALTPLTQEVKFEAFPDYVFGNANNPPSHPYASPITVSSMGYNNLTDPIHQVAEVCINIETDFDSDLSIYLRAPDGKQLELSTGNGGAGDNYKITCFKPTATVPVIGSTAPFNGDYKPEGAWTDLTGAQMNGDWKLMVSDAFGPTQFGKVKWWSIGFNYTDHLTYAWSNTSTLSCSNCPNPVATPVIPTTYIVTVTNNFNCVYHDTVQVNVAKPANCNLTATVLSTQPAHCANTATGSAVISVNNATPPVLYFPDGMGAGLPNGNLNNVFTEGPHFVVIKDGVGCLDTVNFVIGGPVAVTVMATATDALCNNDDSGSAKATASGGTAPINFSWQGCSGGAITMGAMASNLVAGCYNVTATDANGCTASASVTVNEPPPFHFTSVQDSVSCFGGSDGSATITVTGGTPGYTYNWTTNGTMAATANGLNANFHTVVITDANNCQAVTLVQVLQPPALAIDSIPLKPISCFGSTNGSITVYPKGGTLPYTYLWSDPAMQTAKKATGLGAGTYTVTVTDKNGCTILKTAIIAAPPQIQVTTSNVSGELCAGDCKGKATINASGGTGTLGYAWSGPTMPPNGTTSSSSLCSGNYTVVVTDSKNCTQSVQFTVAPATPITLQLTSAAPSCTGSTDGSITPVTTGGITPFQYNWTNGASSGQGLNNLACGNYHLTLTDAAGCTKTDTVKINCPAGIQVTSITPTPVKCFGQSNGLVTVVTTGGTGALTYKWSDSGAQTTATATGLPTGTYTVTITDTKGCTQTSSSTVTQPTALSVSFTKTDIDCFGASDGTVTANASGGTSAYTYSWSNAQTGSQLTNLGPGTFTVTVTDNAGCTVTGTAPAVSQPASAIQLTVTQSKTSCFGQDAGAASGVASGGNGAPFSFTWSNQQTGSTANNLTPGNYTVTVQDKLGCTAVKSVEVVQWDSISINAVFTPPSCAGLSDGVAALNLVKGGSGGGDTLKYTYNWSVPNSPHNTILTHLAGGQNYSLTVSDLQGCSTVFNFFIPMPQAIVLQTKEKDVSCFSGSDGDAGISGVQHAVQPYNYTWSDNSTTPAITGLAAGSYTVTVKDANGCTATAVIPVGQPTALAVTFKVKQISCINDKDGGATATIQGGTPDYMVHWSTGAMTPQLSGVGPGIYGLTVTDKNACTLVDSVSITRPDSIRFSVQTTDPLCFGNKNGRLKLSVESGLPPYQYSLDGHNFGGSSSFIALNAGNYTVYVRDGNGCVSTASVNLNDPPEIQVSLSGDTTIFLGQSVELIPDVSNSAGTVRYVWKSSLQDRDSLVCLDSLVCSMVKVTPFYDNTYTVQITDSHGCRGTASVLIKVEKPHGLYVPTGFTPNGDLNNDLLGVFGKSTQVKEVKVFRIFDRWGELLYEDQHFTVNNPTRGWDGKFRGKDCLPGIYVWYLEAEYLDGFIEQLTGNTALIR